MKADNVTYIGSVFVKICENITLKCILAGTLVISEFFLDTVLAKSMIALFFLILFDWITGIFAARVSKEKIKSSKILRTPIKIGIYFMLITVARLSEYSLPDVVRYLDETMIAFLVLTELISNIENVGKMGYAIPKALLVKLKSLRDEK